MLVPLFTEITVIKFNIPVAVVELAGVVATAPAELNPPNVIVMDVLVSTLV